MYRKYIAKTFRCSIDYLYGFSDSLESNTLTISATEEPLLFELVQSIRNNSALLERLITYTNIIKSK